MNRRRRSSSSNKKKAPSPWSRTAGANGSNYPEGATAVNDQITRSVREAFVQRFGEANAAAIETAAEMHDNEVHNDRGSDPFKWALCIAIGYECVGRYRDDHGITVDPNELKPWVYEHADLANHDGDFDFLAAAVGEYEGWFQSTADEATWTPERAS
jgi:hypothetical protein